MNLICQLIKIFQHLINSPFRKEIMYFAGRLSIKRTTERKSLFIPTSILHEGKLRMPSEVAIESELRKIEGELKSLLNERAIRKWRVGTIMDRETHNPIPPIY